MPERVPLIRDFFRGERVRLTAMSDDDIPTLAAWQQDAEFLRLLDAAPAHPKNEAQLREWLEQEQKSPEGFIFAIRPLAEDTLLGYVGLDGILWTHGSTWLTIAIGARDQQGQGLGREALRLVLGFAFHELNLRRVQLTVFAYNTRAIAAYEALGFQREGTFREALARDGQYHDMYLYGLLRREWEAAG